MKHIALTEAETCTTSCPEVALMVPESESDFFLCETHSSWWTGYRQDPEDVIQLIPIPVVPEPILYKAELYVKSKKEA